MWYEYGIKPMSLDEEMNMSEYAKQTRNNKMKIIDTCNHIKNLIETIELITRQAPEKDDKYHAEIVQLLSDRINTVKVDVEVALRTAYGD